MSENGELNSRFNPRVGSCAIEEKNAQDSTAGLGDGTSLRFWGAMGGKCNGMDDGD